MSGTARTNFTLEDEVEAAEARFAEANPKSFDQWQRARGSMPGH